jgi:hypothetical protein
LDGAVRTAIIFMAAQLDTRPVSESTRNRRGRDRLRQGSVECRCSYKDPLESSTQAPRPGH